MPQSSTCGERWLRMPNLAYELVRRLRCPVTGSGLVERGGWLYATDAEPLHKYPIRHGIALLLAEASQVVDAAEQANVMELTRSGMAPGART